MFLPVLAMVLLLGIVVHCTGGSEFWSSNWVNAEVAHKSSKKQTDVIILRFINYNVL